MKIILIYVLPLSRIKLAYFAMFYEPVAAQHNKYPTTRNIKNMVIRKLLAWLINILRILIERTKFVTNHGLFSKGLSIQETKAE
jgi:hypothetical protein